MFIKKKKIPPAAISISPEPTAMSVVGLLEPSGVMTAVFNGNKEPVSGGKQPTTIDSFQRPAGMRHLVSMEPRSAGYPNLVWTASNINALTRILRFDNTNLAR